MGYATYQRTPQRMMSRSNRKLCDRTTFDYCSVVLDYIEVFYNRIRRHATIQNQVPADYAQQFYKDELQIAA